MENKKTIAGSADGALINIEMQSYYGGNNPKRVRYYQANIDMSCLEKGMSYDKLPDRPVSKCGKKSAVL